jgi:hypothetical protein
MPWTPILPPAPPMTDCPTLTGGNSFALLKARSPRRACDGLGRPWRTCEIPTHRTLEPPSTAEATACPRRVLALRRRSCRLRHASRSRPSRAAAATCRTRMSSSDKEARRSASCAGELRLKKFMRIGITLWRTSGLVSVARTRLRTGTTSATHSSAARHRSQESP